MAVPQTPQFVLYRTTFLSSGNLKAKQGIVLGLARDGAHITSLSINASTSTEPNTLVMTFAIPVDRPEEVHYNDLSSYLFDFKSNQVMWQVMDQVQLFASPTVEDFIEEGEGGVKIKRAREKYYRMFMGIITSITGSWDGSTLSITLTAKDLFYWLSLAKIQQKASIYELLLRGDLEEASLKEQGVLLAYRSKYQGLYIKDIINKILLDERHEETLGIFLPEMSIPDILSVLGASSFMEAYKKEAIERIEQEWADKQKSLAGETPIPDRWSPKQVEEIKKQVELDLVDRPKQVIDELIKGISVSESLEHLLTQRSVRQVMATYWDNEFGRLIRANYVSFRAVTDLMLVPFPIEFQAAPLINGEYHSKLDFLQALSQLTIYEIFQAPQGYIFVKPILYNAPPLTKISPDEIFSVTRNIDAEKILTQVTVQGALVVGSGNKTETGILLNMPPEFPFIQGTFTYLFPKGFKENVLSSFNNPHNKTPFVDIPRDFDNYEDFVEQWKILEKQKGGTAPAFEVAHYPQAKDYSGPGPCLSSIGPESERRAFLCSVANILITNAAKFDIESQLNQYVDPRRGQTESNFVDLYSTDLANLIISVLQERGGFNSTEYDTYVRNATRYYCNKAVEKWRRSKNKRDYDESGQPIESIESVIPATIENVIEELEDAKHREPSTDSPRSRVRSAPSNVLLSPSIPVLARVGTLTIPRYLFRIFFRMNANIPLKLSRLNTGEFNVLQHGLRSRRMDNALVRTNEGAKKFAQFIMDKNNASVETTEITLKTLRLDIVPGFTIYNEMDASIYYVDGIEYRVTAGSNIETVLKLCARRRPVWKKADKPPTQSECTEILRKLQDHESTPEGVFIGTEVNYKGESLQSSQVTNPSVSEKRAQNTYLVGWEYIGGRVEITKDTSIVGFSPGEMVPSFGAILNKYGTSVSFGKEEKKEVRVVITSSDKHSYHIAFENREATKRLFSDWRKEEKELLEKTQSSIKVQPPPPPPELDKGVKFFIPLSYAVLKGNYDIDLSVPMIKYDGAESDRVTINKIVGAWSSGTNLRWNAKTVKKFYNSELAVLLTTRFIMLERATFTLGIKNVTGVSDNTAINYYDKEYVLADFVYYTPEEFRRYLENLLTYLGSQSVLSGINKDSIDKYVSRYEETLEAFRNEKFCKVVLKS